MTKRELRELIRGTIKEFTGTGAGGGGHMSMKNNPSQRAGGGSFNSEKDELDFYNNQNSGDGGQGMQTRGMEKAQAVGNYNSQKQVRF